VKLCPECNEAMQHETTPGGRGFYRCFRCMVRIEDDPDPAHKNYADMEEDLGFHLETGIAVSRLGSCVRTFQRLLAEIEGRDLDPKLYRWEENKMSAYQCAGEALLWVDSDLHTLAEDLAVVARRLEALFFRRDELREARK